MVERCYRRHACSQRYSFVPIIVLERCSCVVLVSSCYFKETSKLKSRNKINIYFVQLCYIGDMNKNIKVTHMN